MPYMSTMNRNQVMMCSLDDFVDQQSIARVIDAFVAGLDLSSMGFTKSTAKEEGRPCYAPQYLLKLYLYGNQKGIRSSRKLEEACRVNIEVRWLMECLEPDFRTISDFRKDNTGCMKKVFHEFNHRLAEVLTKGFLSVDGSKFQANNSKDNNFTANKLDDRIAWLNSHSDEYLRQLAEMDAAEEELSGEFTREELEEKLKEVQDRLVLSVNLKRTCRVRLNAMVFTFPIQPHHIVLPGFVTLFSAFHHPFRLFSIRRCFLHTAYPRRQL